jgi:hypothetical protein
MTETDNALVTQIEREPLAVEHRLVAAVRAVARRIVERPTVQRGLMAAEAAIKPGVVITSDVHAAEIVGAIRIVIDAEKDLEAQLALALRIPKAMEAAVRDSVREARDRLLMARKCGNDARVAWQTELDRRAAAAAAAARAQAAAAAKAAADEAERMGQDAPPIAEVAQAVVPRTVVAGAARSGIAVRMEPMEIVNDTECPVAWKVVVKPIARGFWHTAELTGKVQKPAAGESVVFMGVRFEAVASAVNR